MLDTLMQHTELLEDVLHSVWLHGDWRYLTKKMTTEQREAFALAVELHSDRMNENDGDGYRLEVDRWWKG